MSKISSPGSFKYGSELIGLARRSPDKLLIEKFNVAWVPAALTRNVAEPTPSLTTPGSASMLAE